MRTFYRALYIFCTTFLLQGFLASGNIQAANATAAVAEPPIQVKALNDHLIYFFDGRRTAERFAKD